jgi:hypothetical protein
MKTRANTNAYLVAGLSLFVITCICRAAQPDSPGWTITQLTYNDYSDFEPSISGVNVTWLGKDAGLTSDSEVYFYNGNTIIKLTNDDVIQAYPQVSGYNVVWYTYYDPHSPEDGEIFLYNGSSVTQITDNEETDAFADICGSNVAWAGIVANHHVIFLYRNGTTTQVTDSSVDVVDFDVSESHIAWSVYDQHDMEIFYYDIDSASTTQITDTQYNDKWPDLSGHNLVWVGGWHSDTQGDDEIFLYDGSTTTQLTSNDFMDDHVQMADRNIIWYAHDVGEFRLMFYNGLVAFHLVTREQFDISSHLSDSTVVWSANDGKGDEIFVYNGSTITQLTDNDYDDRNPKVSGRNIVWDAANLDQREIFMAAPIYKMHYPQMPKTSGFDVDFNSSVMLGDNWQCTETGPVKDIRLWVSWKGNVVGTITGMRVRIYSDQPAILGGYSRPKDLLWERVFDGNELTVELMDPNWQGWYEPNGPNTISNDHDQWCQIDIKDIPQPFMQQEGEIYWLVISDVDVNDGQLGWKETDRNFHDVAVWYNNEIPSWQQILDPWFGGPIDLAFVIMDVPQPLQELDFGDVPNPPYPTLLNFGARHVVVDSVYLGSGVDSELNGQPDVDALGDDNDGNDDEDGVVFFGPLEVGKISTVGVTANVEGFLDAWIDFDADDSWLETYDRIFMSEPLGAGFNTLHFEVPSSAAVDVPIYARFRFSTSGGLDYYGIAEDGEVEDYRIYFDIGAEPEVKNAKWSQPPVETDLLLTSPVYCGWDEQSYTPYSGSNIWKLVADDYRCIGDMPVTSVHWWGSYYGWEGDPKLPPTQPIGWRIAFWSNVSADPCSVPYSHPNELLWLINLPASRVDEEQVGQDIFPRRPSDICFKHSVELVGTEYFWQSEHLDQTVDDVFWISIGAVYETSDVTYPWGWKTRPWYWMDDAVTILLDDLHVPMTIDPNAVTPIQYEQESLDVAFALDTDPLWIKWEQAFTGLRDWPHYEDVNSWAMEDSDGNLINDPIVQVCDDWLCRKRTPVTAVVWWGSYLGYIYQACQGQSVAPSSIKPDYFLIRVWTDSPRPFPLGISHPAKPVWEYKAYDYDEVLVGYDKYPSSKPAEPVFRYSVKLPEANWFYQRKASAVYWISIVAVYVQRKPEFQWGWTNHPYSFNDYAVKGWWKDSANWNWQVLRDQMGNGEDMSFMLFTTPNDCTNCADYDFDNLVTYLDLDVFTNDWLWNGPTGGYSDGDLDCDGDADFYDYAILAFQWLGNCP